MNRSFLLWRMVGFLNQPNREEVRSKPRGFHGVRPCVRCSSQGQFRSSLPPVARWPILSIASPHGERDSRALSARSSPKAGPSSASVAPVQRRHSHAAMSPPAPGAASLTPPQPLELTRWLGGCFNFRRLAYAARRVGVPTAITSQMRALCRNVLREFC